MKTNFCNVSIWTISHKRLCISSIETEAIRRIKYVETTVFCNIINYYYVVVMYRPKYFYEIWFLSSYKHSYKNLYKLEKLKSDFLIVEKFVMAITIGNYNLILRSCVFVCVLLLCLANVLVMGNILYLTANIYYYFLYF